MSHFNDEKWCVERHQLPDDRSDLLTEQPSVERAVAPRAYQTTITRALGYLTRSQLHLCPLKSTHPGRGCQYDLPGRTRPWWTCDPRQCVPRRDLHADLSGDYPG